MYIVVNKISVPADHRQAMVEGFKHALPGMKRFSGFLGFELWTAEDGTVQAVSRWESKEAVDEYLQNDLFRQHHGAPASQQDNSSNQVTTRYTAEVLS
ncbi:MAG TPA: antibiotic biosynthesis monooxygenase family protein [Ktedonobacteraceae bacterium]